MGTYIFGKISGTVPDLNGPNELFVVKILYLLVIACTNMVHTSASYKRPKQTGPQPKWSPPKQQIPDGAFPFTPSMM